MSEAIAGSDPDPAASVFDAEFLRKLERLEWVARKVLRGLPRGERNTARRGRGQEFNDFRRYQPGDDFRYIDWNIFSRLDRLVVKLYTSEEDMTLHIVLDCSASMGFGEPSKFDYARRLAAALGFIGLHHLDRVVLTTFAGAHRAGLPPLATRRQLTPLLDYLAGLGCAGPTSRPAGVARRQAAGLGCAGPTLVEGAFRELAARSRGARLMVVISDFMDTSGPEPSFPRKRESTDDSTGATGLRPSFPRKRESTGDSTGATGLEAGLDALRHRGHDVVAMQVLSEEEIAPPLDGAIEFVDAESGETLRATVDARLRALYAERLDARLRALEGYCRRTGIEYLRASTAIPFEDLVLRYLRQGTHLR